MEIKIGKPLRLHLDLVETDEHVPSIRMQVLVDVEQFGHSLIYRGSVWFECSVWDAFVTGLNSISEEEAQLVDMNGHFTLRLGMVSGVPEISWEMKKVGATRTVTTATFRSPIDEDTFVHVKSQFVQFDRWW